MDEHTEYCVYCFTERNNRIGCCGENHFLTGFQIKEHERELNDIDKRIKGASYD
jgi:hypothetical protein